MLLGCVAACIASQPKTVVAQSCEGFAGSVVSVEGEITVSGVRADMGNGFCLGDEIVVGEKSRAAIRLAATQTVVRVNENSTVVVSESDDGGNLLKLLKGVLYLFSRRPQSFEVETPYVNAAIEGTEFVVASSPDGSDVTVIEGSVLVTSVSGDIRINPGEAVNTDSSGVALRRTVVDPLNAAQWALYYPSIGAVENTTAVVRSAAESLFRGDAQSAELALSTAPQDAASLALKSIIAVTRNQTDEALELARRSVQMDSDSSLAYSALSYAQQSQFDIDQALASAIVAVNIDDTNADSLARLAELQLGVDQTTDALASARKAVSVDAQNSRARTILGFARLVRLETDEAKDAFSDAIKRNPGDPLPRLGLGLAVIRNGHLVEGREHLEVAVSLNPANALFRSYLGKAYFEERQGADAREQFSLAKQLDPQDPTSFFYDALLDQARNRPVSAYKNINRARALNDNRLIYQSRLLVDKSASSGALSLARIYTDLGFSQSSINESSRSISLDPANYSAYRLLADSYADRERHESARSNVLFQASLLQPMTLNAVQPYAQESRLLTLTDTNPVHPSINEYSPLFDRQGHKLTGALIVGEEQTLGGNLVLSGLHNRFSYNIGRFHYATNGLRANNDVEHEIYHGHIQAKVRQNVFALVDFQSRKTSRGDLSQNTDPTDFDPNLRIDDDNKSPRIGLRWQPAPRSTFLLSGRDIDRSFVRTEVPADFSVIAEQEISGYEGSARLTHGNGRWNHTLGVDNYELDVGTVFDFIPCIFDQCPIDAGVAQSSYLNYYYYADWYKSRQLQLTLGLSYTSYDDEEQQVSDSNLNPKFGVRWTPTDVDEYRFAVGRGIKRRAIADQTLEPTTLAGFNQIYDNFTGSDYINTGFAYDRIIADSTSFGLKLVHRELDVPHLRVEPADGSQIPVTDSQSESIARSYWTKILHPNLTVDLSFLYERFERDDTRGPDGFALRPFPLLIETVSLPVGLRYTHSSGFFAHSEITGVYQRVDRYADSPDGGPASFQYDQSLEKFMNVNLSFGFNLYSRNTLLRLDINNVFDESLRFQGHDIQSGAITSPRYSTKQLVVARMNVSFR